MGELRENPIIRGERVIFAPGRSNRPDNFKHEEKLVRTNLKDCPFCPGNENKTPKEFFSYKFPHFNQDSSWKVRVIPNMYPALTLEENPSCSKSEGFFKCTKGFGICDVIITKHHDKDIGNPSFDKDCNLTREILWAFNERKKQVQKNYPFIQYLLLFKNRGKNAGASIEHAHLQVIGNEHIPKRPADEIKNCLDYYKETKRCLFCNYLYKEKKSSRKIEETENFIAFAPYASRFPYEVWVAVKNHKYDFNFNPDSITECEIATELSTILRRTFHRLNNVLGNPSYNFWLHDFPLHKKPKGYHWHFEIVPKLVIPGGFERGTDEYINIVLPEKVAEELRNAL